MTREKSWADRGTDRNRRETDYLQDSRMQGCQVVPVWMTYNDYIFLLGLLASYSLYGSEGEIRRTVFLAVLRCSPSGFSSGFTSFGVFGCSLVVVGVPVKVSLTSIVLIGYFKIDEY